MAMLARHLPSMSGRYASKDGLPQSTPSLDQLLPKVDTRSNPKCQPEDFAIEAHAPVQIAHDDRSLGNLPDGHGHEILLLASLVVDIVLVELVQGKLDRHGQIVRLAAPFPKSPR